MLLTCIFYCIYRGTTLTEKHNLVHLNLAIALLLAVIVFATGIETAKSNEVSCLQ